MTTRRDPDPFDDLERQHPTVADGTAEGFPAQPLAVRLVDLWSDFVRTPDERETSDSHRQAGVPLLDEMKGILQWD